MQGENTSQCRPLASVFNAADAVLGRKSCQNVECQHTLGAIDIQLAKRFFEEKSVSARKKAQQDGHLASIFDAAGADFYQKHRRKADCQQPLIRPCKQKGRLKVSDGLQYIGFAVRVFGLPLSKTPPRCCMSTDPNPPPAPAAACPPSRMQTAKPCGRSGCRASAPS